MTMNPILAGLVIFLAPGLAGVEEPGRPMEELLLKEELGAVAKAVREQGDPARGAAVFYQPFLNCVKCHVAGEGKGDSIGPDLSKLGRETTDAYLVESLLQPSKVIKKGFETITIGTAEGKVVTGVLAEDRPDHLVIRDLSLDGKPVTILKRDIEQRADGGPSVMPAGLSNGLSSRQQFLDLIRYLREIADGGPDRARALAPDPTQIHGLQLPEYEQELDHAGMIADLGPDSLKRGEAIYNRVCVNCHGTKVAPGSLPTSLRFATGQFKNGRDPLSLYRTLTLGFGQMTPQTWMVPTQKYDVIHYVRETFLKTDNPTQYAAVDRAYLDRLPKGTARGPEPSAIEARSAMDYGPALAATYEVSNDGSNFAYKGIAVGLDAGPGGISRARHWSVFDHDTMRLAASWSGAGFIDWNGINFNGRHEIHPRIVGLVELANPIGPGWADPQTGSFTDPRFRGRDGRPYGPLPRSWAHFQGQYRHGERVVFAYTVGNAEVLEMPGVETGSSSPIFARTFAIGPRDRAMVMQVARQPGPKSRLRILAHGDGTSGAVAILESESPSSILSGISPPFPGVIWSNTSDGDLRLTIPAGEKPLRFTLKVVRVVNRGDENLLARSITDGLATDLVALARGGPTKWPEVLKSPVTPGQDAGPFAVDTFGLPERNPWLCQMRLTGFDFLDHGRKVAVCTWDGDVWIASGIEARSGELSWNRIASGLFQPLGLKVRDGNIFVACRDQIVILRDLNGDGETDFYENFNSDHQVTEHFHEFAMGLQTDAAGNFYYAKAACHGKTALVPQHGTLLRVSRDGFRTEILATGFRAPNGVCVNDDGSFFLTDQEGFWTPKNRINHVKPGGFYGNLWGYHDVTDPSDAAMEPPVCWITNEFDRSPAELVRVTSDAWGPLKGSLLNLSYGNGNIFVVPYETVGGVMQGGMCALPIAPLPTGVMRGRFHPKDGQLYACGMFAWAGNQTAPGGFYRIRATGKPMFVPSGLGATKTGLQLTFTDPIGRASVSDPSSYSVRTWSLKRSANYGSQHYDEKTLNVSAATLSEDGRSVFLTVPDIRPTWGMEIHYRLKGPRVEACEGKIHNTIHRLAD